MKRTPVGHIRKHWLPCKDCDQLGHVPVKVQTTKGVTVEDRQCFRCKGSGLMLASVEELTTLFEEPLPKAEEGGKKA